MRWCFIQQKGNKKTSLAFTTTYPALGEAMQNKNKNFPQSISERSKDSFILKATDGIRLSQWQLTKRCKEGKDFALKEKSGRVFINCQENKQLQLRHLSLKERQRKENTEARHYRC